MAGLDLNFGISYNSLVWLKDATNNESSSIPIRIMWGPDSNLAFQRSRLLIRTRMRGVALFVVGTDGSRIDFRQDGTNPGDFYPGDSSYRYLYINNTDYLEKGHEDIDITIVSTDGTKMHYLWDNGAVPLL